MVDALLKMTGFEVASVLLFLPIISKSLYCSHPASIIPMKQDKSWWSSEDWAQEREEEDVYPRSRPKCPKSQLQGLGQIRIQSDKEQQNLLEKGKEMKYKIWEWTRQFLIKSHQEVIKALQDAIQEWNKKFWQSMNKQNIISLYLFTH